MKGFISLILIIITIIVAKYFIAKHDIEIARRDAPNTAYIQPDNVKEGPIISFNFDDGFLSAFNKGIPIIEEAGFKTTHYIISRMVGDVGYMTRKDILQLQVKGHEIGAHTLTHANLPNIPLEDAREEIFRSKKEIFDMGVARIETFAYPNGNFNESVVDLVKQAGFSGARITNPGLNDKTIDPYKLYYSGINSEVSFEAVKKVIDSVIAEKKWLIMVFHRVGESGYENVSPDFLQKIVDHVKEKNVPVVTTTQGLSIMKNISK
jgi:peptidoglycan/xylan/chitin deacetylase (PgdA/CDA1 family)